LTLRLTHHYVQVLRPYQVVSIVPGCLCISRKTSLVRSLLNCYGPEVAFRLVPRTFKLPEELDAWADWLAAHPQQVRLTRPGASASASCYPFKPYICMA
jgi:hypothetical protein